MKKTKIIATIGPATRDEARILDLYKSGVNVIRCNFSHATYPEMEKVVEIVQRLNSQEITKLWLMLDTKGPEIRTGDLAEKRMFEKWEQFYLWVIGQASPEECKLLCDYPYLVESVEVGKIISIDSGLFDVEVKEKWEDRLLVEAKNSALIGSRRHINFPGVIIRLPGLTDKDKEDIRFGMERGYDMIAMSFVRTAEHVHELRAYLKELWTPDVQIIAKIENQEGIEHMDEIIRAADGVMVARGDLGIEVPIEQLPVYQQEIVTTARKYGKFVIVATHLLESMVENPFPTRAEVTDIFNAVQQQADAIMLSAETSLGKYPIKSVEIMKKVILHAESTITYQHHAYTIDSHSFTSRDREKQLLIKAAIHMAETLPATAILVFTKSGKLAKLASAYRPTTRLFAITNRRKTIAALSCYFGILTRYVPYESHTDALNDALELLKNRGELTAGDKVIVVTDFLKNNIEEVPVMELFTVA